MNIYTIGFTKKSAEQFFSLLKKNNVKYIIDVRVNNSSQLAGFTKGNDLQYFLKELLGIGYIQDTLLAPSREIFNAYRDKSITWSELEVDFIKLLEERNIKKHVEEDISGILEDSCLLCSEETPERCHRKLVAEYIQREYDNEEIRIIHL